MTTSSEFYAHEYHERDHDHDVPLSHNVLCLVDMFNEIWEAFKVSLSSEDFGRARSKLDRFYDCQDSMIKVSAETLITTAHINSVGDTESDFAEGEGAFQHQRSKAFAKKFISFLNVKTNLNPRYAQYVLRLRMELAADADREGANRFLPKDVLLVDELSDPVVAREKTCEQVFTLLNTALNPSE